MSYWLVTLTLTKTPTLVLIAHHFFNTLLNSHQCAGIFHLGSNVLCVLKIPKG